MSSNDFLNRMLEAGEKHSASDEFLTVAKMIIRFGYSGFLAGHKPADLFVTYEDPNDADKCADTVTEKLASLGSSRKAVFAIEFNIPEADNTSTLVTWDINQVTLKDNKEGSEYRLLVDAIKESSCPISEWFWGSYKNIPTGEYEKNGETKKRYMSLPVDVFANEEAARQSAGASGSVGVIEKPWSDKVLAQYDPPGSFEEQADDIHSWLKKAAAGQEMAGFPIAEYKDEGGKVNVVQAKRYVAQCWGVETTDIDLLPPPF
jgi:hypothetical protein